MGQANRLERLRQEVLAANRNDLSQSEFEEVLEDYAEGVYNLAVRDCTSQVEQVSFKSSSAKVKS